MKENKTTVKDLIAILTVYASNHGNSDVEVLVAYGDAAFPFSRCEENVKQNMNDVENFLILMPNVRSKRLILKGDE